VSKIHKHFETIKKTVLDERSSPEVRKLAEIVQTTLAEFIDYVDKSETKLLNEIERTTETLQEAILNNQEKVSDDLETVVVREELQDTVEKISQLQDENKEIISELMAIDKVQSGLESNERAIQNLESLSEKTTQEIEESKRNIIELQTKNNNHLETQIERILEKHLDLLDSFTEFKSETNNDINNKESRVAKLEERCKLLEDAYEAVSIQHTAMKRVLAFDHVNQMDTDALGSGNWASLRKKLR
jgi:chromosome segregation ATPase